MRCNRTAFCDVIQCMLISVHIPKCAGTSFRHVLEQLYGARLWMNYGVAFSRQQANFQVIPAGTNCIHGHFLADTFDDVLPNRRYITWVRHPVERVVSNYYHFLRGPDMRDDCCRELFEKNLNLLQFAELPWMRNETTRYLSGKRVEEFEFIGVVERFEQSMEVFAHRFAAGRDLPEPRVNCNPDRKANNYELSSSEYAALLALNADDVLWYEAAVDRLHAEHAVMKSATHSASIKSFFVETLPNWGKVVSHHAIKTLAFNPVI